MRIVKGNGYNIYIGNNVFSKVSKYLRRAEFNKSKIFVLTDNNSKKYCLPIFKREIKSNIEILEIKSGEKYKTLSTCEKLWKQLASRGAERDSLLINLGGGVITDLGGFVASAFKRGIRFINIPTTLLSQVDASVGGKTGVDLDNIKNELGFFSNPAAVFVYPGFLNTLPVRELLSGYAEVIKHTIILDSKYWEYLKSKVKSQKSKVKNISDWTEIIYKSVDIKNKIVSADPFEQNIRKKLNFGHTIGHAIESVSLTEDKEPLLHGEAIAIGMICESYLSYKKTGLPEKELKEIKSYILSIYRDDIPIDSRKYQVVSRKKEILSMMAHDKKNKAKVLNFTLIRKIGSSLINQNCTMEEITESLRYVISN